MNYRLEPLGTVEGFTAEVGASGTFCPSHMTFPVDVSFYSVSDDNAPSPYMVSSTAILLCTPKDCHPTVHLCPPKEPYCMPWVLLFYLPNPVTMVTKATM